jgi:putative nucleotidyltransferase with HDIG domain
MNERPGAAIRFGPSGQLFLGLVIVAGLAAIVASVFELHAQPIEQQWYLLAALTLVSGSATVNLPSIPATISISETFVFASVLLFGSAAGTVTVALDGLVISFWMAKRRPEWYRALFNMTAPAVSIWCASQVLFNATNIQPLIREPATVNTLLLPLIVFTFVYFGLNSGLISLAVSFETKLPPYVIWRDNFRWISLNYFCGASVALLLVVYTRDVDLRFIGVIVPLLLVLYITFKTSMQRVEDANSHVQQVDRLYLSTIETLAMAIDAKDQITHGHIRRVQTFAVGLARRIGVTDVGLLKAIEAAALLHDTGKLAVPEYILNKPGKLTAAEFDKMKLHVTVGADILTAIEFPYPVVPIVRCHHESWDGSGYPSGLRGTDIPIGARILAVVDCFDALTSDRPYRPRLSDEEAFEILFQRRGSMYDPLVVDTFARVYQEIAPEPLPIDETRRALQEITSSTSQTGSLSAPNRTDDRVTSVNEILSLFDSAHALAGYAPVNDTCEVIAKYLHQLIPSALCIFYSYDASLDELEARYSTGEGGLLIKGLRIELGHRLSGWVAANRRTIMNSDPVLDLGELARSMGSPPLRSSLSTPLVVNGDLVGVLTLYSRSLDAFNEDHRHLIEAVGEQIADSFRRARDFEKANKRRTMVGTSVREPLSFRPSRS